MANTPGHAWPPDECPHAHGPFRKALVLGGQAEKNFHHIGQAHRHHAGQEEVETGDDEHQRIHLWVLFRDKVKGGLDVPAGGTQQAAVFLLADKGDVQEDFHHRRGEEAQAAGDEDGHQAEEAVQKAAQDGAHQIRQGIDLNDHAVGLHQVLVRREGWDAGLDGGLVDDW